MTKRMQGLLDRLCYLHSGCHRTLTRRSFSVSTRRGQIYDVVTVGGGPVGLALVAALKSSPITRHLRVALIEAQPISKALDWNPGTTEYANRTSSLTPASVSFLSSVKAWERIDHTRTQPYHEMRVWDASNASNVQFRWSQREEIAEIMLPTVATMIENANLVKGLVQRILDIEKRDQGAPGDSGSSLRFASSVSTITNGTDNPDGFDLSSWPVISFSNSSTKSADSLTTRLLVGADGANSPVRSFADIGSRGWDYQRHGVVATLRLEMEMADEGVSSMFDFKAPTATAYQRFLPSCGGPIALLPLPQGNASLVWSTTPSIASHLKSLSPEALVATVNAAFLLSPADLHYIISLPPQPASPLSDQSHQPCIHQEQLRWRLQHAPQQPHPPPLVKSLQPNTLASFPLRFRQSSTYTGPRTALVGDAAHTIHPLAGQGLNLGLADACTLFQTIESAVLKGQDLGDELTVLSRYNAQRWSKGLLMGGACDAFHWLYGFNTSAAAAARAIGMSTFDRLTGVKEWLMTKAAAG